MAENLITSKSKLQYDPLPTFGNGILHLPGLVNGRISTKGYMVSKYVKNQYTR